MTNALKQAVQFGLRYQVPACRDTAVPMPTANAQVDQSGNPLSEEALGSFRPTASAAAYRSQNVNVSPWLEPGVETRALAFDEHVDVASNRRRRIAEAVAHARPARLKSIHQILDRLRLDLHDALGVGKERPQQGRQPDDSWREHQTAVIVSTDEIAGRSRAMHSQVSPSSRLA